MRQLTWVLAGLVCCGFTPPDLAKLNERVAVAFTAEDGVQVTEKSQHGKHRQILSNPRPMPDGTGGQFQFGVDEYVGPQGVGYTLTAKIRQASCAERPTGEPCVWRYQRHEGPESYRDKNNNVWILEPLWLP